MLKSGQVVGFKRGYVKRLSQIQVHVLYTLNLVNEYLGSFLLSPNIEPTHFLQLAYMASTTYNLWDGKYTR